MTKGIDIHQHITDKIVSAIEAGAGQWQMPWHRGAGGKLPINTESGQHYRGANVLALWCEAQLSEFASNVWGTYRQWAAKGAQVQKGAKASYVVFYREIAIDADATEDGGPDKRLIAQATPVFNADQVEGLPATEVPSPTPGANTIDKMERLISATKAVITHGGAVACFIPSRDEIRMPPQNAFKGSKTSTPTEAYYSTLLHELSHWTGVASRCNRDLTGRFGTGAYAMEELVAELGAAFLRANLGLSAEPRQDHAQYLAHWLTVLKADKRAIFTAASKAAQAATYIQSCFAGR